MLHCSLAIRKDTNFAFVLFLKCLMKISELKVKGALKSSALKMSVDIIYYYSLPF